MKQQLTQLIVQRISKKATATLLSSFIHWSVCLGALLGFTACADKPIIPHKSIAAEVISNQRIFYYPYDNVWRAVQLALKYPISVNNMDNGIIETDSIHAIDGFQSPVAEKDPSSGIQYKITLTLSKGRSDGKESVRVNINKKIERRRDFFSDAEELESDGLEEQVIFYRIERELVIEDALKKANERANSKAAHKN